MIYSCNMTGKLHTKMASKKIPKSMKEYSIKVLKTNGEDALFQCIVRTAVATAIGSETDENHEEELLDLSESFMALYRRTGDDDLKDISRIYRKAAHKLHRELKKVKKHSFSKRLLTLLD